MNLSSLGEKALAFLAVAACAGLGLRAHAETSQRGTPCVATARGVATMEQLVEIDQTMPPPQPTVIHEPLPRGGVPRTPGAAAEYRAVFSNEIPGGGHGGLFSPSLSESFPGLGDNNTIIPPDTDGAVGPNNVVTMLNNGLRIDDKVGNVLSTVSLQSFWSTVLNGRFVYDPRIEYDPYGQRWMASCACYGSNFSNAAVLLAVSANTDPAGTWYFYSLPADPSGKTWLDFDQLGFNSNWIVVTGNMFTPLQSNGSGGQFQQSTILAIDKADVYANGTGKFTLLADPASDGGFAMMPVATYDGSQQTEYLIEDWNGDYNNAGYWRLSTISGAVGSESLSTGVAYPSVPSTWSDYYPNGSGPAPGDEVAPQKGTAHKIDNNDARIASAVYRNGSVWCAQNTIETAASPNHTAIQWFQVNTASGSLGTVQQYELIDDPTAAVFRAFPSIAVNSENDVLIGYSEFSSTMYASGYYAFRLGTDTASTLEPEAALQAGAATYYKTFSGSANRWGDYSATSVDPADDLSMWTIQEYAASPANTWGTWWGEVPAAAAPSLTALSLSASSVVGGANVTGTVTLSGMAPYSGETVTLQSANSAATVPATVTVPFQSTTAQFTITTASVTSSTSGNITATLGANSFSQPLTVTPAGASIKSVTFSPSKVAGTLPDTGKVTLKATVATDTVISITSSNPTVASFATGTITIPAGSASGTFPIATTAVTTLTKVKFTAKGPVNTVSGTLSVAPIGVKSLAFTSPIIGGKSEAGTVTLQAPAEPGSITVTFGSSNTSVVPVPASITIAAGQQSGTFTINTNAVTATTKVTISGAANGAKASKTLTVNP